MECKWVKNSSICKKVNKEVILSKMGENVRLFIIKTRQA